MVKSDICWMSEAERGDCEFDNGGYFIIKGAEKVFVLFFLLFYMVIINSSIIDGSVLVLWYILS